jgi:hypothetical protein
MTRRAACVAIFCSLVTLTASASWLQSSEPLPTPPNLLDRLESRIRVLESQVEGLRKALQIQDHPPVEPTPPSTYAPTVPYSPGNSYSRPPATFTPIPSLPPTNAPTPPTNTPEHWQKLEINGQTFYIVPAGELPHNPAARRDSSVRMP